MSGKTTIILWVVLLGIALLVFMYMLKPTKEGFETYYGPRPSRWDAKSGYVGNYDHLNSDQSAYGILGKMKYNSFSDTLDVSKGNFIRSDKEADILRGNIRMQESMITSDPTPSQFANTLLGLQSLKADAALPPENGLLLEAKKCEALRTRGSCAKLGDKNFANCGICVKGGTPYSYENPEKHIGGLLLIPEDREDARLSGNPYQPTIGECPEGAFFVDREQCEIESNRLDCRESGESGGFKGGRTVEGRDVVNEKCAQVPKYSEDTFIYEPKDRQFGLSLRVLTPVGTGICKVLIYDDKKNQIGYGESKTPGQEFKVDISSVKEGDPLNIILATEVPYRNRGKSEVFLFSAGGTKNETQGICQRIGATAANLSQMNESKNAGGQNCSNSWGADFYGYITQAPIPGVCDGYLNSSTPANQGGNTYCFGVKPPESDKKLVNTSISPFFQTFGSRSTPSQDNKGDSWSRWGGDYQAPYERGVLLQWEMSNRGGQTNRTIQFEPTIVEVNNIGPTSTTGDGSRVFKNLRRFGTFGNSSTFQAPKPTNSSIMARNQFWIWSNQPKEQQVNFKVRVPGIFLETFYEKDRTIGSIGPLIGRESTLNLLRTSPCLKEGQAAGKYSIECLQNLFVSAGGDIGNGKLVTTNGGLSQLNSKGDMDAISAYLTELYDLATTGRDSEGNKVGLDSKDRSKIINDASQLMFGFDISTPCEDVSEDATGNIVITPKVGYKDAECLDWLWRNTGNDQSRYADDGGRNIKNTYVSIGQRFSGLMSSEGSKQARENFPFQTCQRTGTMSPLTKSGSPNLTTMEIANSKGDIPRIQDFYNGIFQTANTKSSKGGSSNQSLAVEQCYGINKA